MSEAIVFLPLSQGKVTVIDFDDFEKVGRRKWYAAVRKYATYAQRLENGKCISIHATLIEPPPGFVVDHINHDGLDNRRENLRAVTKSFNQRNRRKISPTRDSKYKGVTKICGSWGAAIRLGVFESEEAAARAYDAAALYHFGENACLNFPNSKP